MHLKIVEAEELLFKGDIYSLTSQALDGSITCQDLHDNYLTILQKGEVTILEHKSSKNPRKVTLKSESILFIDHNRAMIFC